MDGDTDRKSEKRRYERFEVRQIIDIAFPRETFFHAEGLNLGEGGMLCRTSYPIEPLSTVYFLLELSAPKLPQDSTARLPQAHIIKTQGTVVHTRVDEDGTVFGVEFEDLTDADRDALRAYLETASERNTN